MDNQSTNYSECSILFIDDEPGLLSIFRENFDKYFKVFTASSAKEGLNILEAHPEMMVAIADQKMPFMKGTDFLAKVKEKDPYIVRIVLTAYADFDIAYDAINKGSVYRYILKPWEINKMEIEIKQAIDQYILKKERDRLFEERGIAIVELNRTNEELKSLMLRLLQTDRLSSIGALSSSIYHDIVNYVDMASGEAQMLAADYENDENIKRRSDIIKQQCFKIIALLKNIVFYGKGKPEESTKTNILQVLNEAVEMLKPLYGKFVSIDSSGISNDLPPININIGNWEQVFTNLLINSYHAMPIGGKVFLRATHKDGKITIEVEDTGTGIAPEHLPKIFDMFYTTKTSGKGTGLGLYTCRKIIEEYGGTISVDTQLGKGTKFTITIPVK